MAEALTVEVEMDEAVEDFDGEIDEQSATNPPSGADHDMVISIMCLMIPLLVAFGGQIYLGASALISLNEITSESGPGVNTTSYRNGSALEGFIGLKGGASINITNITVDSGIEARCPTFEDFGTVYSEPEHVMFIFGVCALATAFPPFNIIWYTYGWIGFSVYICIEGDRLQQACPGPALDTLRSLVLGLSIVGGSACGLFCLIACLTEALLSYFQRGSVAPVLPAKPAIKDLEKRPDDSG